MGCESKVDWDDIKGEWSKVLHYHKENKGDQISDDQLSIRFECHWFDRKNVPNNFLSYYICNLSISRILYFHRVE